VEDEIKIEGTLASQGSSWGIFTKEAQKSKPFGFEQAISLIKDGHRLTRLGWNGKDMFVYLYKTYPDADPPIPPYIMFKTADNKQVPWDASQTDLLATDWDYAV
jgi:hypothetical protein